MTVKTINIGNSKGIRIPSYWYKHVDMPDEFDVQFEGNKIILAPAQHPREGWRESFKKGKEKPDDPGLAEFAAVPNSWDETEWEW